MMVWLVRALASLSRRAPQSWLDFFGVMLGRIWHDVVPIRRQLAREQVALRLRTNRAETARIVRAMYEHLGKSFCELFRYGTDDGEPLRLRVIGHERLDAAIARGRGVVAITAHLGNWEVLARFGAGLDTRLSIVTKRLSLGAFDQAWRTLREGSADLIDLEGAAFKMVRCLKQGEIVGVVLDQHAPEDSAVVVPFLGEPAATSTGVLRAARITGAPVIPLFTWREGRTHVIEIGDELDCGLGREDSGWVEMMAAVATESIEEAVRRHPAQWLWLHRRWKVGALSSADLSFSEAASEQGPARVREVTR